jgi:phosphohistidine phosphatase
MPAMRQLFLVRHGLAVDRAAAGLRDADRPLTPEGIRKFQQVARGFARLDPPPLDAIYTSPWPRALETASILARALDRAGLVFLSEALTGDVEAAATRDWLAARTEKALALVGHNPGLSTLAGLLIAGQPLAGIALRKGGIAALETDDGVTYRLNWIAPPKLLRALS